MPWPVVLFALIPVVLGCVFIVVAVRTGGRRDWRRTPGRAFTRFRPGLGHTAQQYSWQGPDGVVREGTSVYRTMPLREGTPITVLYDPEDLSRSRIDSFWHSGTIFLIVGGVLSVVGVIAAAVLVAIAVVFPA